MRKLLAALALLALPACGLFDDGQPTVIDGSTPETFKQTVDEARAELGPRDRLKFEAALTAVRGRQFAAAGDRAEFDRRVRKALDGQTASQIVAGVDAWTAKFGNDAVDKTFEVKRELTNLAN